MRRTTGKVSAECYFPSPPPPPPPPPHNTNKGRGQPSIRPVSWNDFLNLCLFSRLSGSHGPATPLPRLPNPVSGRDLRLTFHFIAFLSCFQCQQYIRQTLSAPTKRRVKREQETWYFPHPIFLTLHTVAFGEALSHFFIFISCVFWLCFLTSYSSKR